MTDDVYAKSLTRPSALVIATSDQLPLTSSKDAFFEAVRQFVASRDLPIVYLGPANNDLSYLGTRVRKLGILPYQDYRKFLRSEPLMSVVPLEAHGDPETTDFVSSKSD